MFAKRSPLWALCCLSLAASVTGVVGHVLFVAAPRGQRVARDVDATAGGGATPTMTSWRVATDVLYRYAKTTLATRLVNPAAVANEISFSAVLPQAAFISAFHIEMDGKVYDAYVKEKEAAQQEYTAARERGWTAATVVKARDSNVFTVSVNVEAAGKVTFNLTYEELLTRRLGLYHHVINIDPGQVVPDMSLRVRIEDALPLVNISVPALRMSNEILATDGVETETGASGPASISRPTPEVAVVEWTPSAEEQRSLRSEGLRAQLVVQYDVDRENNPWQILLGDGYFVHFYAPTTLTPLRKHVVFVLDVSGSMSGRKMPQLREAMATVLADLRQGDAFSIVTFENRVEVWQPEGSPFAVGPYQSEMTVPVDTVVAVSKDNIARAQEFVAGLEPLGGTNIHDALMTALNVVALGRRTLASANIGNVPEPLVVFLTDGQANAGALTASADIVQAVTAKNERRAPVFCLAFGRDAQLPFLKQLALANAAFARLIYEAGDAALQLRDFYRQVASPLLANVTFRYEPEQVDNSSLTTLHFDTLFAGSELVVAGRLVARAPDTAQAHERLDGDVVAKASTGEASFGFRFPKIGLRPAPETPSEPTDARRPASFMERLWAYLTVQQLLDKERAVGEPANSTGRTRALQLALKYSFVTSLTSLVVVKPNATAASLDPVEAGADAAPARRHHPMSGASYPGTSASSPRRHQLSSGASYPGMSAISAQRGPPAQQYSSSSVLERDSGQLLSLGGSSPDVQSYNIRQEYRTEYRQLVWPPSLLSTVQPLGVLGSSAERPMYLLPPTPRPPPPPTPLPSTTPAADAADGRVQLTVSDITWAESVKNATHVFVPLAVPGTGTTVTTAFEIGTGQPDVDTGICARAGKIRYCRHLSHCVLPEFKDDFSQYVANYFCGINGFAGVCCPSSHHAAAGIFGR